jgi:two-component system KDP operon response regulator KdpE
LSFDNASVREAPPAGAASPPREHASVLVVEDDPAYGPFVVRALERIGIGAVLVKDGIAALKLAKRRPPPLILLDLTLPGLHGFKVLRSLRNDPRTVDTRVIVITGHSDPEQALLNASDALRANAFFSKASDRETLIDCVRWVLEAETPQTIGTVVMRGCIGINIARQCVMMDGKEYFFTSLKCLCLFATLLDHDGAVSPERLLRQVWPRGESVGVVAVTVQRLRKEFEEARLPGGREERGPWILARVGAPGPNLTISV